MKLKSDLVDITTKTRTEKIKANRVFYIFVFLIWILNIGDMIYTRIFVDSGIGYEANPIMRSIMNEWGPAILIKVVFLGILLLGISILMYSLCVKIPKRINIIVGMVGLLYLLLNIYYTILFAYSLLSGNL